MADTLEITKPIYMTVVYRSQNKEDMMDFYEERVRPFLFNDDEKVSAQYVSQGNTTIKDE